MFCLDTEQDLEMVNQNHTWFELINNVAGIMCNLCPGKLISPIRNQEHDIVYGVDFGLLYLSYFLRLSFF